MIELLTGIITNPYAVIVTILSVGAAISFLVFLWGFSGYILAHGDVEHQHRARMYMLQGFAFLLVFIVAWEIVRSVVSYFS